MALDVVYWRQRAARKERCRGFVLPAAESVPLPLNAKVDLGMDDKEY
jgi:hypothetical protein